MERVQPKFDARIYEQACEWFVELRAGEPDARLRQNFHRWLKQAPVHMAAYLEAAAIWNESSNIHVRERWPLETLIAEARSAEHNIMTLPGVREELPRTDSHKPSYWKKRWSMAACVAALGLSLSIWMAYGLLRPDTYNTGIGEQRSISLPDGSTLQLNARSAAKIHYSGQMRRIELLEGQALFTVVREQTRPFIVFSGATQVRALGTQFDVNRTHAGTTVSVLEGTVAVQLGWQSAKPPSLLAAGEQVIVTAAAIEKTASTNITAATAWTQRRLVFASTPLGVAAEEFNRYNRRQLVIEDSTLADFRIDGVFSSTDPAPLIRFLRERHGVKIEQGKDKISISRQ